MLATLANARRAAAHLSETLDGLSVDADMRALDGVREQIARIATEGQLDRELGAATTSRPPARDPRRGAPRGRRRELAELKRRVAARTLAAGEPPAPIAAPEPALAQAS